MATSGASRRDRIRSALSPRIRRLLTEMWEDEDAARSFADPEGVHQMRVATRRIRSILQAGGSAFDRGRDRRIRAGLRRLARALGAVRDGDVLIGMLEERTGPGPGRPGVRRLIARLSRERDASRADLIALLDELDEEGFRDASLAAFETPKGGKRDISRKDARRMIREPVDAFTDATAAFPPGDDPEALHRLRIATKRLRYALQILDDALPGASAMSPGLTGLQDELGEIHNLDVLMGLVRGELHAMTDEAAGRAIDGHHALGDDAQAEWDDLLSLLRDLSSERAGRYQRTRAQWTAMANAGLRDDIRALAAGSGSPRGAGA